MPNQRSLSIPDLNTALFGDIESSDVPMLTGQWFAVKIIPDLVADDTFNIGIAFINDKDAKLHYKLIPSVRPFQCLYGKHGLDNFNFLLNSTKELMKNGVSEQSASPHIIYSSPSYASGTSIDEILNSLYSTVVRLQCIEDSQTFEDDKFSMSSENLRRKLFTRLKNEMPLVYDQIYRQEPIKLLDRVTNKEISVELPIWNNRSDFLKGHDLSFGSIVSAQYKSDVHRGYSIEHGCTNVRNACEIKGKKVKAGILIYRPVIGTLGFDQNLQDKIDRDIDQAVHSLRSMQKNGYDIDIEVEDDMEKIYKGILALS